MTTEGNRMCDREEQRSDQSPNQEELTICGLEQTLANELAKLRVNDMDELAEKMQQTKERIKSYGEDEKGEIDQEMQTLTRFKQLTLLGDTIRTLKSTESVEDSSSVMEIYRLEQTLINGLAKLKIVDDNFETPMNHDREKEEEISRQMKRMTLLKDTITELKTAESVEASNHVTESCWLKQEWINGFAKLEIDNVKPSSETMQQTKERLNHYHKDGRKVDTEKGLSQLKNVTLFNGTTTELATPLKRPRTNNYSTPSGAVDQSTKRSRTESERKDPPKFFARLPAVNAVTSEKLRDKIQQKCRDLCKWPHYRFPGPYSVFMHRDNYEKILESPYLITWKSVGKRYMMFIEERGKVYMFDEGKNAFSVDHIQFPIDAECTRHLKDTLVVGEFVFDNVDGLFKPSFWINDIISYDGHDVSNQPFKDRLKLISTSIVQIRDSAIEKTTQPFLVKNKDFFGLSEITKLLSAGFLATIPHRVDGFFFQPENDPYRPGDCPNLLKWKEKLTIEFRLKISDHSSDGKKEAQLFLSNERQDVLFETMTYSPDLEKYDNKIISCSFKGNQWHFHRLREDRSFPNALKTAGSVLAAMQKPVTREVLGDLIENQFHDDKSSSTTSLGVIL